MNVRPLASAGWRGAAHLRHAGDVCAVVPIWGQWQGDPELQPTPRELQAKPGIPRPVRFADRIRGLRAAAEGAVIRSMSRVSLSEAAARGRGGRRLSRQAWAIVPAAREGFRSFAFLGRAARVVQCSGLMPSRCARPSLPQMEVCSVLACVALVRRVLWLASGPRVSVHADTCQLGCSGYLLCSLTCGSVSAVGHSSARCRPEPPSASGWRTPRSRCRSTCSCPQRRFARRCTWRPPARRQTRRRSAAWPRR